MKLRGWISVVALLLLSAIAGCAHSIFEVESMWEVPYPPGERPSSLWIADARTQGWIGVHVTYYILGRGDVDADVSSHDQHQHFTARGEYWYENEKHEKCDACDSEFLVVKFGQQKERYQFGYRPGDRAIITLAEPDAAPSLPQDSTQ